MFASNYLPHTQFQTIAGEGVDGTYRKAVAHLQGQLKEVSNQLPFRLGLVREPGGQWADFAKLELNRELPRFVAADLLASCEQQEFDCELFCRAHYLGAVYGLIADRIADGQVQLTSELGHLRRLFREEWENALRLAVRDRGRARLEIANSLAAWRRGIRHEREYIARGHLTPSGYAQVNRDKLYWIAASARCLVACLRREPYVARFQRIYDLFMCGLQCLDDFTDADRDRAARGCDVPSALSVAPGSLLCACPALVSRAAEAAEEHGFAKMSVWFRHFLSVIGGWMVPRQPIQNEFLGQAIALEIDDYLASEEEKWVA